MSPEELEAFLEAGRVRAKEKSGEVGTMVERQVVVAATAPAPRSSTPAFPQMALGTLGRMRRGAPTSMSKKKVGRWTRKIRRLKKGGGR